MQIGTYYVANVIVGQQIARTLGCPTANISVPDVLLRFTPGVYAGSTILSENAKEYPSCIFVDAKGTIEAHCIDQTDLDLYGKEIRVNILHKIRDIQDFSGWTLEQIKEQIAQDVTRCR